MSKAAICVVTYSIGILLLFGVFSFLMSTVNPPPIGGDEKQDKFVHAGAYLRNMDHSEDVDYGIEKAPQFGTHLSTLAPFYFHNLSKILPTVKYKNPYLRRVHPPSLATASTKKSVPLTTFKNISSTTMKNNITDSLSTQKYTKIKSVILHDTSIKGHRRSVNEKIIEANSRPVILKILDNSGQSRLEIKLSPNEIYETKSRMHRSYLGFDKIPVNMEIKILPNNTVVISDVHDSENKIADVKDEIDINNTFNVEIETVNMTNGFETVENNATITITPLKSNKLRSEDVKRTILEENGTTTHIISKQKAGIENIKPQNSTSKEVFGLKVLFDNVTKSFTEPFRMFVAANKTK